MMPNTSEVSGALSQTFKTSMNNRCFLDSKLILEVDM